LPIQLNVHALPSRTKTFFILAHNTDIDHINDLPLVKSLLEVKSVKDINKSLPLVEQGTNQANFLALQADIVIFNHQT
jgi:hypothetical protein